jgi:hypothetical protein
VSSPWSGLIRSPPDTPSLIALALALVVLLFGRRAFAMLGRAPRYLVLAVLGCAALALSAGYISHYLRGGPRVIDATSYWLQAKALSEGYLSFPIGEPTASVRGRFLLTSTEGERLGVIFPPGYPALLALGFWFEHPLWVGPIVGALLVAATYVLALRVSGREDVARLAACLSVISAALRYHTADTMSHGLAALLVTSSLACVYAAKDSRVAGVRWRYAALSGGALGWLAATRPFSALAVATVVAVVAWGLPRSSKLALVLGALPLWPFSSSNSER